MPTALTPAGSKQNYLFVLFSIVLCVLSFEATAFIGIGKSTEGCGSCSSGGRRAKHGGF